MFLNILCYKFIVRFRNLLRHFSFLLNLPSDRFIEYDFARKAIPKGKEIFILDIGSNGSLLPLLLAREDHYVTVYDFRGYPEKDAKLEVFTGDFLQNKLPASYFDIIMLISTIEHIGFSGYSDPAYTDGDYKVIEEAKRLLKPNGKIIITLPFSYQEKIIPGFERWYDLKRISSLFRSFTVVHSAYYIPKICLFGRWLKWQHANLNEINEFTKKYECQGCACFILSRQYEAKGAI